ncbi:hypothetical protein F5Y19DRAFT_479607 [Xylariaceae sp. FL1651]|nr:hypothetical protein F5Y19DRAFT_479607 [Xylariaceae sp. FL1651]
MSKALGQAAKLKPEIRLAQALSEFGASLEDARTREFRALQTRSPPNPEDVIRLTEEINRDGSRMHKAWRPYATRIVTFLEKIQVLSRVGDFLIGSSQNLIASGVWAAIKITLSMALGSLGLFKRISEVFLHIRKSASSTKDLAELFPSSKELQDLMCEYFITLLSFCQKTVQLLNKSIIIQLASPFVVFFDKEALKFESDLQHWSIAIDQRFTVLKSQRQMDAANTLSKISDTLSQWTASEAKKKHSMVLRSERLLDRLYTKQSERFSAWLRQRKKGTTQWLFKEPAYSHWKTSTSSSTLWINGKLGSGKTVLLANIVADLYTPDSGEQEVSSLAGRAGPIVAYFFCQHDHADSNKYDEILGSVFQQVLKEVEPDSEPITKLEECLNRSASSTFRDEAVVILRHSLPKQRPIFIVLDALDECPEQEVTEVLVTIKSISETCAIHLCCSTRTDAPASQTLTSVYPTIDHQITMSLATMANEMKYFVEAEFERRRHIRNLDRSLEDIIKEVLIGASEGMYLWVALQIEALFPHRNSKLLSESDIYGSWKIYPRTFRKLSIGLSRESRIQDTDSKAIVALCGGGLLEIEDEDDTVHFIHHSVYQHLVTGSSAFRFRRGEADIYTGSICVTYLNYPIFNTSLTRTSNMDLKANQLASAVNSTTSTGTSTTAKVISILRRRKGSDQSNINIGQIIQRYLEPKVDTAEILAFFDYARDNWIMHTMRFCPRLCADDYPLFEILLHSAREYLTLPWKDDDFSDRLKWAQDNKHFGILLACLFLSKRTGDQYLATAMSRAVEARTDDALLDSEPSISTVTSENSENSKTEFSVLATSHHAERQSVLDDHKVESISPRAATWGIRPRSLPDISDKRLTAIS